MTESKSLNMEEILNDGISLGEKIAFSGNRITSLFNLAERGSYIGDTLNELLTYLNEINKIKEKYPESKSVKDGYEAILNLAKEYLPENIYKIVIERVNIKPIYQEEKIVALT